MRLTLTVLVTCAGLMCLEMSAEAGTFFNVPALSNSTTTPIVDNSWDDFTDGEVTLTFQATPDSSETEGFGNDSDKTLSNSSLLEILGLDTSTPYNRLRNNAVVGSLSSTLTIADSSGGVAAVYVMVLDLDQTDTIFLTSGGLPLPATRFVGVFDDNTDATPNADYSYIEATGELDEISPVSNLGDYIAVFDVSGLSSVEFLVNSTGVQFQAAVVRVPEAASGILVLGMLALAGVAVRR